MYLTPYHDHDLKNNTLDIEKKQKDEVTSFAPFSTESKIRTGTLW